MKLSNVYGTEIWLQYTPQACSKHGFQWQPSNISSPEDFMGVVCSNDARVKKKCGKKTKNAKGNHRGPA